MPDHKEAQFLEFYDEYGDAVFRHCYFRVSDREKAKDIVQDTFKKLWQHVCGGGHIETPKAFIFKIANNLIIDTYRKRKDDSLDALQEEGFDPGVDDRDQILDMLAGREIIALLDSLDGPYRDVIVMRYLDDMAVKDIAALTGVTENLVSVRLHRGMQKIKQLVKNHNHE